ncbi:MAG TPA: PQQ-binding-like beta-propeller repeat protein, partial [Terriglobia bacterium]|nr:PQQ-binding-like beta-propeller repeat protein [Terriglobia bacterium]
MITTRSFSVTIAVAMALIGIVVYGSAPQQPGQLNGGFGGRGGGARGGFGGAQGGQRAGRGPVGADPTAVTAATPPGPTTEAGPPSPILEKYQAVTTDRLKNPEASNWLMIRRTYDGWGFSPLDQINTQNVSRLKPVWNVSTGEMRVHESAPIVNNGAMFVSTPNNQVIAFDARTGTVLWRYRRGR